MRRRPDPLSLIRQLNAFLNAKRPPGHQLHFFTKDKVKNLIRSLERIQHKLVRAPQEGRRAVYSFGDKWTMRRARRFLEKQHAKLDARRRKHAG